MILLDTHTWIWWYNDPTLLSIQSHERIKEEIKLGNGVFISSISAWEIALLITKKKLTLAYSFSDFISESEKLPFVHFIPVDNDLFIQSVFLPKCPHKDPADRIILATALKMDAVLITKDELLHKYKPVKTDW